MSVGFYPKNIVYEKEVVLNVNLSMNFKLSLMEAKTLVNSS